MSPRWFYLILAAEAVLLAALRWPRMMDLAHFAHADSGAVLSLAHLTAEGLRPGIDFIYLYGLGAVAFGDIVFGGFGLSPGVYAGVCVALGVAYALAVGVAAVAAGARGPGYAIVMVGLALGMPVPTANFVHLLEPILLSLAIAAYTRGRPRLALALATGTVFVKPALAYPCGLLLVLDGLAMAFRERQEGVVAVLARRWLPAAVIGLLLGIGLVLAYGLAPLFATILPTDGVSVFEAEGFGFFFGQGRLFWNPPGVNVKFYLGTPTGFWLAATLVLTVAAIITLATWIRGRSGDPAGRAIIACGVLHVVFVLLIFGPPTAWGYDFNLVLIGFVAVVSRVERRGVGWAAVGVAVLGCYTHVVSDVRVWREYIRVSDTPGLYARPETAADWGRLTSLAKGQRVFVFHYLGGASVLNERLGAPASWCLYWWLAPAAEIERTRDQLRAADVVAIPRHLGHDELRTHPANGPPFADCLREFPFAEDWTAYRIYRRSRPIQPAEEPVP